MLATIGHLLIFSLTLAPWLHAQERRVAFVDVTVVPMDKEQILPHQTVVVVNGRITQVASSASVEAHGRFSGKRRPANWIAADIVRIEDGILVEHWDVLQVPRRNRLTSSRPVARRLC